MPVVPTTCLERPDSARMLYVARRGLDMLVVGPAVEHHVAISHASPVSEL